MIQSETECDYRLWASNAAPVACLLKKMMFLPKIMLIYDKPLLKVAAQLRVEMFSEKKDETTLIFSLAMRLRPTQTRKFSQW